MKGRKLHLGTVALLGVLGSSACDPAIPQSFSQGNSVRDVSTVNGQPSSTDPLDWVRARIRNESSTQADVTLRLMRADDSVDDAFVRVMPGTITTIGTPARVQSLELFGMSHSGRPLPPSTYVFGVDFDGGTPAEYLIRDPAGEGSADSPPERPIPTEWTEIVLLEPAVDLSVRLGSTFDVVWTDRSTQSDAQISIFLRPVGTTAAESLVSVSPRLNAAIDGLNDRFEVLAQNVAPGRYFVLARLQDGDTIVWSVAPGAVTITRDPRRIPPGLSIVSPIEPVEIEADGKLLIEWKAREPGGGVVSFSLETSSEFGPREAFQIGPEYQVTREAVAGIGAEIQLTGVLPGVYDLVGTVRNSHGTGTDRRERVVHLKPTTQNNPPQLQMLKPAEALEIELTGSFVAEWTASDPDDDARISLLLDPDIGHVPFNGNEILLVSGISEDASGSVGTMLVSVPAGVERGVYRLVGVISDGAASVEASAPGILYIGRSAVEIGDGGGGGGGGGGGPNGGGDGPDGSGDDEEDDAPSLDVRVLEPTGELRVSAASPGVIRLALAVPVQTNPIRRFFLSNLDYGGDLRVELDPRGSVGDSLTILIPPNVVPNDAWPRVFDLEIESIINGETRISRPGRPIWIRQEVAAERVRIPQVPCPKPADPPDSDGTNTEIEWYGGGFGGGNGGGDVDQTLVVEFWLTSNGQVTAGGGAPSQQLLLTTLGSPNQIRVLRITSSPSSLTNETQLNTAVEAGNALTPGDYHLVAVVDPNGPGRTVSQPLSEAVTICPGR